MNSVAPISRTSAAPSTRRRIDVKAILTSHLTPYAIARKFEEEFQLAKEHALSFGRNIHGDLYCLMDGWRENYAVEAHFNADYLRSALPAHAEIKTAYGALMAALHTDFDEPNVRLLIGLMLDGFRAKPGETAPVYVDALAFTLEEATLPHYEDLSVPVAAVADAVRRAWASQTFPPSVHEFLGLVETGWKALLNDLGRIRELGEFSAAIDEVIAYQATLPKPDHHETGKDDDDIPF
jgi:hypothetical protein